MHTKTPEKINLQRRHLLAAAGVTLIAAPFEIAGLANAQGIAPGVIKTPMHPVETHAQLAKLHPLGRMGEISDIVGAILYLELAGFVTGETIHVDGGQSAGH